MIRVSRILSAEGQFHVDATPEEIAKLEQDFAPMVGPDDIDAQEEVHRRELMDHIFKFEG